MKTVSVSTDNCNNPLPGENTTSCHSTSSSRTRDEPLSSDHSLTNYCVCVIITIVSVVVRQDVVLWWLTRPDSLIHITKCSIWSTSHQTSGWVSTVQNTIHTIAILLMMYIHQNTVYSPVYSGMVYIFSKLIVTHQVLDHRSQVSNFSCLMLLVNWIFDLNVHVNMTSCYLHYRSREIRQVFSNCHLNHLHVKVQLKS